MIRIGTRGSKLALAQAEIVSRMLESANPGLKVTLVKVKTEGDSTTGATGVGDGKAAFTKAIEERLIEGEVDLAVHSAKDLQTHLDGRLTIAATPERGDPRDALVSRRPLRLLPKGGRIGTSSLRRKAQILRIREDLEVVEVRGNVETRIGKMEEEGLEGVLLAAAGLARLGLVGRVAQYFDVEEIVPAPCQGIIAVEARADDIDVLSLSRRIDNRETHDAFVCERAFSKELGGDCNVPVGAYAKVQDEKITLTGFIATPDGSRVHKETFVFERTEPAEAGRRLARLILENGGTETMEVTGH